tara:strand:- start:12227 stop:13876 length:1650 start_codon:yes stop_codon:yes gene_type:complete
MASTFTTNLGIEKPATGDKAGTWGTMTNTNMDLIDEATNGVVSITLAATGSSGSPNDLPITNATSSNGRNKFIEFVDGGDLGGTAFVQLSPNDAEKIVFVRNSLSGSRSILIFQGTYDSGRDFEILNGKDYILKFPGSGSSSTVATVLDNPVIGSNLEVGDNLTLSSDSSVLSFGADSDVTITHNHNTGITLNDKDISGVATINGAGLQAHNYILNPEFNVAQRGKVINATTPFSGANNDASYTLDKWILLSDGNDIVDIAQTDSNVPTGSQNAIELEVETANKKFGIVQFLENVNCESILGQEVTLSFQAQATANLDDVRAAIIAWDGTEDAPTKDIINSWEAEGSNPTLVSNFTFENTPADLNVTTSFAKYSITATIDTSGAKNVAVFIWSNVTGTTAGTDKLQISQVQLEKGSSASAFSFTDFSDQFLKCARYFRGWLETSDDSANASAIATGHSFTTSSRLQLFNVVPFRATPTIDQNELLILSSTAANVTTISSIGTVGPGQNGLTFNAAYSTTSFTTGGQVALFLDTAESGTSRCFISCELGA